MAAIQRFPGVTLWQTNVGEERMPKAKKNMTPAQKAALEKRGLASRVLMPDDGETYAF